MNAPLVDVVILNYNGREYLDECLTSVLGSSYSNKRIYLLDNASTADDVAYVKLHYPVVRIIQNTSNNGYCAAYNLAFAQCGGKYIVCLNNDVTVAAGWIEHMVELAESDSSIAAIQPKIVSYFDEHKFEYAGASGGMMDQYGFPFLRGRLFDTMEDDCGQYDDVRDIFWTSGAAMFLRKDALRHSGVLDETIVHHMDEIDLCWRLRLAGYNLKVQPASVIRHIGGATIPPHSYKKVYWNHRNSLYIMLKNYGIYNMCTKVPVHVLLDYVAFAHALLKGNLATVRGVLAAHVWIILNLILIARKRAEVQQRRILPDSAIMHAVYRGSVVWEYFVLKHKTFQSLTHHALDERPMICQSSPRLNVNILSDLEKI